MEKYNMMYEKMGKDGFPDHGNYVIAFTVNSAEEANKIIMSQMFFGKTYYAQNTETGEIFHGTTKGLRNINSYGI